MSSDHEISKEVTKLLLDTPGLRLLKAPPATRHNDGSDAPGGRVRPHTIFLLTAAMFLQIMSAQIAQPERARALGLVSLACFLWGAFRLVANDAGHPSVRSALSALSEHFKQWAHRIFDRSNP